MLFTSPRYIIFLAATLVLLAIVPGRTPKKRAGGRLVLLFTRRGIGVTLGCF